MVGAYKLFSDNYIHLQGLRCDRQTINLQPQPMAKAFTILPVKLNHG